MAICIACGLNTKDCECFGAKPKSKLDRYNDGPGYEPPLEHIKIHGSGGYTQGCRCQDCYRGRSEYYEKNRESILAKRKERHKRSKA